VWPFRRKSSQTKQEDASVHLQEREQGRRFREDIPYALPKDNEEGQRLDLQHYLFRYVLQGNFTAPFLDKNITQVLDVGSGTGIWGHEMSRQFPHARVYGMDLEPPQTVSISSTIQAPPENYHFLQGNVLKGLPFPENLFDFTHQRMLCAAIPDKNWPYVLYELLRVTRPGSWIELLEVSDLLNPGICTKQAFDLILQYLSMRGISYQKFRRFDQLVTSVGPLVNVQLTTLDIPIGWKGHVGELMKQDTIASFKALQPKLCQTLHISSQAFDQWIAELPKECQKQHSSFRFSLVIAQKPL
jgi:ubiquinone/menaquinone biosynthesis C-methylase UbiE